ncbi:DUF6461 domain-containing protein [Streptomyces sp. NPDC026673]|uniref:DUF6461 domain-containing protein n=1 Tax=Streptomyces sp. NPDC026673 TaxID=3155724 RepID=UPI0033E1EC8E
MLGRDELAGTYGDLPYADDGYLVSAGRSGEWASAWEHGSRRCVEDERPVLDVSAGTRALVLHADEKPMVEFRYAEDGHLVTGINTLPGLHPDRYTGRDPRRFTPAPRALGAVPEAEDHGPLGPRGLFHRLAEGLGAGLPHADLTAGPVLVAQLPPGPADGA